MESLLKGNRLQTGVVSPYNLRDFADWLSSKAVARRLSDRMAERYAERPPLLSPGTVGVSGREQPSREGVARAPVEQSGDSGLVEQDVQRFGALSQNRGDRRAGKRSCLYCLSENHYFSQCPRVGDCRVEQLVSWIRDGRRCWKCGQTSHRCADCSLRKPCEDCGEVHLRVLHRVATRGPSILHTVSQAGVQLVGSPPSGRVYLKVVPVRIINGDRVLDTYAVLDDGAERSMLMPEAAER